MAMMDPFQKELIKKAKNGDEESFETLIKACSARAYNIALRYLRNEEDALDVLQESYIKIFRYLGRFREDSSFDTWVYRIVVNSCNDFLRKNSVDRKTDRLYRQDEDGEVAIEFSDPSPNPEEQMLEKEKSQEILNCLERLPQDHREVLILREIQGFSYEEIAQILKCSQGTVKSRINRGRSKLREIVLEQKLLF